MSLADILAYCLGTGVGFVNSLMSCASSTFSVFFWFGLFISRQGVQGQKIRVGKQVCIHHRQNAAVRRGLGGSAGFVSVRWGYHGSSVGEEAAPGWAGGQGWRSGR